MKDNIRKFAVAGIICELLYFAAVTLFLVTHLDFALTLWELMTVVGAVTMLIVMVAIGEANDIKTVYRRLMTISLSGTTILTAAAHFTSIGVVRPLAAQGEAIPEYFKIGAFPSIEMTVDYTAWGFFMGLAFISLFLGIKNRALRIMSLICGILCFIGFTGSFFFDYLWYPAIMGYGLGFLIMCLYLCAGKKSTE